jgi:hypothetical protein
VQVLDLNADGYPELIVHNHLKDGVHVVPTYIYWNGAQGFHADRRTELPAAGPHFSQMAAVGGQFTRKFEEEYTSPPLELPAGARLADVSTRGEAPAGSRLTAEVRQAATREGLAAAPWRPASQPAPNAARWMQYRVLFHSNDAASWPKLYDVQISFSH